MAKRRYRVRAGDNPLDLAKRFRTTQGEILRANGIKNLTPGQTIRLPLTKSGPKGFYTTGENERKTVTINGQTVRMGPNSTITPGGAPRSSMFQNIWNALMGGSNGVETPSQLLGVQGSVQPGGGGHSARPAQFTRWGNSGAGVNVVYPTGGSLGPDAYMPRPNYATPPRGDTTQMNQTRGSYQPAPYGSQPISLPWSPRYEQQYPPPATQYANYGIPDTVRNTMLDTPQAAFTGAQISQLYPNWSNSDIASTMQNAGYTYNMQNDRWEAPPETTPPPQPGAPKGGYGAAWEGTEGYGDGLRSRDSFENYKQNFRAKNGRDAKRWWVKNSPQKVAAIRAAKVAAITPTPQNPDGQVNSLVAWNV